MIHSSGRKKVLHMRILFGKINIEKTPVVDTLQKIINEMLCENLNLKEKLDRIQREKMNLMLDNKHLIETLEESNNMKNRMENDLFERFIKVLNSKKEKIKELRQNALSKGKGAPKDIDKYECDTDVDSESEEEGDKQASSASDKDEMTPDEMQLSDSDERLNKCVLLPKRNRQKTSLGNKKVACQQTTSSGCDDKSEKAPTVVPSTSGMKVNRVAFVDSEDELQDGHQPSVSDREKITPNPKPQANTMHSPKKHGRFRKQVFEDDTSKPDSEIGPSAAKVPKIENVSSSDEIKSVESDNICNKMHREPEVCVKSEEFTSSEQVSVRDLIDGLFS
ncbi:DNA repair protein XRCC4-like [Nilaparvata lugens]|uniref:DNA repair protein XRCC4-like n=1 Tax=Nilaparvata lugens TaxID=108931 RepID=UPI00193D58F8|nr:DNA repair protein XRCC4-like [Nilaparvata lugens]XP_039275695.1 DNA repair protein XRCC4-like [Nilaparvata lugens]XP_039275696.1 DNA repair protein XRCC4-like [Nilaparvata lugens]